MLGEAKFCKVGSPEPARGRCWLMFCLRTAGTTVKRRSRGAKGVSGGNKKTGKRSGPVFVISGGERKSVRNQVEALEWRGRLDVGAIQKTWGVASKEWFGNFGLGYTRKIMPNKDGQERELGKRKGPVDCEKKV